MPRLIYFVTALSFISAAVSENNRRLRPFYFPILFLLFFFIFARIFFFFLVGQKWRKKRSGGLFLFYLGGNIFFVFLFWRFLFLPPINAPLLTFETALAFGRSRVPAGANFYFIFQRLEFYSLKNRPPFSAAIISLFISLFCIMIVVK